MSSSRDLGSTPTRSGERLRLATRGSALAKRQAEMVAHLLVQRFPGLLVDLCVVRTEGDRRAETPLSLLAGQGVFVKEIQLAVKDGRAAVAVHSAKDLPPVTPDGLCLAAVLARGDPRDALVGSGLSQLRPGSRVATGSARRRAQLANLRPDLCFVGARGNIETRIAMTSQGKAEAVVVALAALDRLHLRSHAAQILEPSVVLPQVGQGAIALECASEDQTTLGLLRGIDDAQSHECLMAERAMLLGLGASCALPVGALAERLPRGIRLRGMAATADGRAVVHSELLGDDPDALGAQVADRLLAAFGDRGLLDPTWRASQ
ncbi:MAG: hydroxymethylbilane synthase [Acidimicrobiales bacterium]